MSGSLGNDRINNVGRLFVSCSAFVFRGGIKDFQRKRATKKDGNLKGLAPSTRDTARAAFEPPFLFGAC
jgi:hypothetical protein